MTDSVPIPLDVLAETQAALDCALALVEESAEAYGKVMKARVKLVDCLTNKPIPADRNCDKLSAVDLEKARRMVKGLSRLLLENS
jgi:hypothetical protein